MEKDPTASEPDEAQDSQQEPKQDSGLQTPQPDQPMPTEQERFDMQQAEAEQVQRGAQQQAGAAGPVPNQASNLPPTQKSDDDSEQAGATEEDSDS